MSRSFESSRESSLASSSVAPTVAVVGGGLAGLTAAMELARGGVEVTVFEQASEVGGRARSREVSGFTFNMGPHALYAEGAACRIVQSLGVPIRGHRPPLRGAKALCDGEADWLPIDGPSLLRARWLPWRAKLQVVRLFARLPKLDAAAWRGQSVEAWLQASVSRVEARHLFTALLRLSTYSADPSGLDAETAIRQLQLGFAGGVLYLDGGWQVLVRELEQRAADAGVRWVTQGRVRTVRRQGDGWGVMAGADAMSFDGVVLAVGPSQVAELLGSELPPSLASTLASQQPIDAACLDVALRRLPDPQRLFALGIDQAAYISVHSATASLAPEGGALIHVLRYLDGDAVERRQEIEQQLEALLDLLQPGWRPLLVERQLMPRLRVCHGLHRAGVPRPEVTVDGLPNLCLAGDWVGGDGLLADAAVGSGWQAARQWVKGWQARQLARRAA